MHSSAHALPLAARIVMGFSATLVLFLVGTNIALIPVADRLEELTPPWDRIIREVDLNEERNLATWCSSTLLMLNSLLALALSCARQATSRAAAGVSGMLAVGFLCLSIDDFVRVHESIEEEVAKVFLTRGTTSYDFLGVWFGLSIFTLLAIVISGPYLRAARRESIPFLILSLVFVAVVVLAEVAHKAFADDEPRNFRLAVVFEEGAELGAIWSFLMFQYSEWRAVQERRAE